VLEAGADEPVMVEVDLGGVENLGNGQLLFRVREPILG
jgi:hypothetical protein